MGLLLKYLTYNINKQGSLRSKSEAIMTAAKTIISPEDYTLFTRIAGFVLSLDILRFILVLSC